MARNDTSFNSSLPFSTNARVSEKTQRGSTPFLPSFMTTVKLPVAN